MLRRFMRDEQGQVAEIILIIALAIVAITVVVLVGGAVDVIGDRFQAAWDQFWTWFTSVFNNFGGG